MEKENIFKNHHNREDLAGEHALGDLVQAILLTAFFAVWIADSFFLKYSVLLTETIPIMVRLPPALIVFILSGYLARSGLVRVFGEVRQEPEVIREGAFRLVRHPIYLAAILFYLGFLLFSFSLSAAIIWIIIIGLYIYLCRYEEKLLLEKFGKEYEEYMKEVPMLIPH